MCQALEDARVASPDGSHRQRPSRAEDRLGGNRYQDKAAGGQAYSSASPAAFPARATVFGRVIGSYPGAWPRSAPAGGRLWAFRCSGEGRSRSLLSTRDAGLLVQMQILRPGAR